MDVTALRAHFRRFADLEARGVSELYTNWAEGVAADESLLAELLTLPRGKRQANLLFAAARHAGAPLGEYSVLRAWLCRNWPRTRETMLARSTQTNEAGRCATLLPLLAALPGPLALIEVGASAGLCLYPDRYGYELDTGEDVVVFEPRDGPSPVRLRCSMPAGSVPAELPWVTWRAGIDLNPLDVTDPEDLGWLESLIWPEHEQRYQTLRHAAAAVAADPPLLTVGDLNDTVESLVALAPAGSTVVVFHSAVLVYLDEESRREFSARMLAADDTVWISNEGTGVLSHLTGDTEFEEDGRLLLCLDGRPVARTGPHGQSYEPLPRRSPSGGPPES